MGYGVRAAVNMVWMKEMVVREGNGGLCGGVLCQRCLVVVWSGGVGCIHSLLTANDLDDGTKWGVVCGWMGRWVWMWMHARALL